jgi:hypothetical protein
MGDWLAKQFLKAAWSSYPDDFPVLGAIDLLQRVKIVYDPSWSQWYGAKPENLIDAIILASKSYFGDFGSHELAKRLGVLPATEKKA